MYACKNTDLSPFCAEHLMEGTKWKVRIKKLQRILLFVCLFPAKLAVAVCATKTYLRSYQNKKKRVNNCTECQVMF